MHSPQRLAKGDIMRRAAFWSWGVVGVVLGLTAACLSAEESLARKLPPGAAGSVEVVNAASFITRVEESELLKAAVNTQGYRKWADSKDGKKFRGGRAVAEGQFGMNLWEAGRRILGDRIIAAAYPPAESSKKPQAILLIHLADADIGPHLRKQFEPWTDVVGDEVRVEDRHDGWYVTAKDGTTAVLTGQWLAAATSDKLLSEVTSRLASDQPTSLAVSRPSQPLSESDTRIQFHVDLDLLRQMTHQTRLLPAKLDNPLGSLLLGSVIESLAVGSAVQSDVKLSPAGFEAQVRTQSPTGEWSKGQQALLATRPTADELTPTVPRQLAGFTLCREWTQWYQSREELLIDRVLPQFDKFETGLATFLPGKDFALDVLGLLNAPMSFVAAGQTYAHLDGKPGMQLPAFAVVLDLREPQKGSDVVRLFFQTLGSIVNIEAAKQGRQPWVMDSEAYHGVQVTYARYLETPKGDDLPMVFNFQPASGLVGNKYVVASSLELCRDLIDALQPQSRADALPRSAPSDSSARARNGELSFDPAVAAELLAANRAILTAKGVQSGKPLAQAEEELDYLLKLLKQWSPIRTQSNVRPDGLEFTIHGTWK
jgi:hypothetical protein